MTGDLFAERYGSATEPRAYSSVRSSRNRLLLLDVMGMAYRAFHAIRELGTRDGRPTNALFGFARQLNALRQSWAPSHVAAVFDGGLPSDRLALLPSYKAQRSPMPDALRQQLPWIEEYLQALGAPFLRMPGEEADDIIATLAREAAERNWDVLMATSDKDLFQVVDERVRMFPLAKDATALGPRDVEQRVGVRPDQIVDWLSLVGDAVDAINGVPGIGPKTAARWLADRGSLAALFNNPEALQPPRLVQALLAHRELVRRNQALIRMRRVAGLPGLDTLVFAPGDLRLLHGFLDRFELHSLKELF